MTQIFNTKAKTEQRKFLRNHRSQPEIVLWDYLRKNQLLGYKFRRQVSIGNYIVDFYCPKLKLVLEADGDSHFSSKAIEYDNLREKFLKSLGLNLVRFGNIDIMNNIEGVMFEIDKTIKELTPSNSPLKRGRKTPACNLLPETKN